MFLKIRTLFLVFFFAGITVLANGQDGPETTPLYYPYAEWTIEHSGYSGNPFDIVATVTFTHTNSGEQRTTEMFYDGDWDWETESKGSTDTFKFRFSGTRLGEWTYSTSSDEAALDGLSGSIKVVEQSDQTLARGFIGEGADNGQSGRKWIWKGSGEAFIPRLVMKGGAGLDYYHNNISQLEIDISEFLNEHGFNGFHTLAWYSWWDINAENGLYTNSSFDMTSSDLSPDTDAFVVIEQIIQQIYEAGGFIHIWNHGPSSGMDPDHLSGGKNGNVMQRLQRYVAARLGAMPGWTMGLGWDLWNGWNASEIQTWGDYYNSKLGWNHIVGARAHRNDEDPATFPVSGFDPNPDLDYKGHEDHATINYDGNVAYDRWITWFNEYQTVPHFSEDRFRQGVYNSGSRDFGGDRTRITLWQSAMVGGIATIWGNAPWVNGEYSNSTEFPNKAMFKVFSDFWTDRFTADLVRDNSITDGYALTTPSKDRLIFYKEDTGSIDMDLTGVTIESAIAVDTRESPYNEINISSTLTSDSQNTWSPPGNSDWVISINGSSDGSNPPDSPPAIDDITTTETTAEVSYSEISGADSYEYRLDSGTPVDIGTTNPFEITSLNAGTSYDLQMRSVNSDGVSNWSESTTFTTQEGSNPPESPPTIDEVTTTETTATVNYTGTDNTDSYEYRLDDGDPVDIGTSNPFEIESLSSGTSYDLQMRSVNSDGTSAWSSTTTFTTEQESQPPESPPAIDEVLTSQTTATVSYNEFSGAESYEYRIDSGEAVNIGTSNPFTIEELSPGTTYNLQMRSVNSDGSSDWSETTTFTTSSESTGIPDEVILEQNYPNPFNPGTTIRYGIPEAGPVLLEVYDLLGKKIETLVDEQQTAGFHEVTFNATNLSSGIYIYQLKANSEIRTEKMLLVK